MSPQRSSTVTIRLGPSGSRPLWPVRPFAGTRAKPVLVAAGALAVSMALAMMGPAAPGPAALALHLGGAPALGLILTAGLGVFAWHLARLSATRPAGGPAAAVLPALLPALCLPQPGIGPLLLAAALALAANRRDRAQQVVALLVQCAAWAAVAGAAGLPPANGFATVTVLIGAGLALHLGTARVANDNPSLERRGANSWLIADRACGKAWPDSNPGKWGVT
ncbi:hypothetical protein [Sphingosinithalassobacter sp. CS137]|uniref:hypothetical protein n=1 Tax=Sphingosinithalassobacter sp. CS137 TaxID=2762748 RepID=UPI00165D3640|nr:hypothetical protein [Sphingosinithalassobacter sp. CS137]